MKIITILFATSLLASLGSFVCAGDVMVMDAYARSSGKTAKAGAAFLMIHNHTDSAERLISAYSDVSKMVQLHTHEKGDDGVMKMRHVEEGFVIPAGGMRALKRGADHIMFMGLNAPWEHGDRLEVTLTFENAGEITINIIVDMEREEKDHDH